MHNDIAIAIAWPQTLCKQPGSWYDPICNFLGLSKNHYYKVGHSAVVLINSVSENCHYFDFGRYHAPFGYGRVRDVETDHDINVHTKAVFKAGEVINIKEILEELLYNDSTHGDGYIAAAVGSIHFDKAFARAKQMQRNSPLPYGPFVWKGTNCSRFVRTVILAGKPSFTQYFKLLIPFSVSPTPIGIVNVLRDKLIVPKNQDRKDITTPTTFMLRKPCNGRNRFSKINTCST